MMSRPLDVGIDQINTLILKMGKLAEDSLALALKGFFEMEDVHVQLRAWSNTLLILSEEVEDRATELMALHQPMAGDLRNLKAYIKIAYDMERFGRYALDISDILIRLGYWKPFDNGDLSVDVMGERVKQILSLTVKLAQTREQSLIWTISEIESEIDDLYLKNLKALGESANADAKTVIANLLTIRYLERIADHASYVAESITYAETGKRITLR
jgi:phosphate transport system protein